MKLLLLCLSVLAVCADKEIQRHYEHPSWQLFGDQPKDRSFEVRYYNATKWVSTKVSALTEHEAEEEGFRRLFRYISGENDKRTTMQMTIPVPLQMFAGRCVFCKRDFIVSFYIPSEYQENPPIPNDKSVYIDERHGIVLKFGGYARTDQFYYEAYRLSKDLARNKVTKFNRQTMVFTQYNSPFKLFHRRNEVWFLESSSPSSDDIDRCFGCCDNV
ncbi:unnamed protein product [Clavelina lepadiformis]|uniref:Heme-binding protein 2 n=1 Tax=Clavelina lepadiformis TaxID=159417 RepID=A0ABP0G487_CLALP